MSASVVPMIGPRTTWIDPQRFPTIPAQPYVPPQPYVWPTAVVSANADLRQRPFKDWDAEDLEELARAALAKGKWATLETIAHELAQRPAEETEA